GSSFLNVLRVSCRQIRRTCLIWNTYQTLSHKKMKKMKIMKTQMQECPLCLIIQNENRFKLPVPTTQLAKISKLLLTMEKGHLSSLQGKSLDEIELEEELALTDTEAKDSEGESDESDTAVTASEGGNAEPVGAALASTLTEQVQETADLAGTVSSTVDETASPSEGKTHQEHHSRKVKKKIWSKAEEAAVMRHFKAYILKGRLATKHECSHCKMVEGSVLAQRTVQNIRDFVRNRGTTAKRKAEQQKL
ncbi:unnamed protein product, partial [Pleuronectes platessa]